MAAVLGSAHVLEPGGENTDGLCPAEFLVVPGWWNFPKIALRILSSPIPPSRCHLRRWKDPGGGCSDPWMCPSTTKVHARAGKSLHGKHGTEISTNSPDSKGSRLKTQLGKQDTDQISLILEDKSIVCREETVPANPNTTTGEARRGALRSYPGAAAGIPKLDIRQRDVGAQRSRPTVHHTSR
ncbi:hypothetical protein AV530_011238 [Patagioenas fasciata monilis]|uniref:Uncharacterized protein n=1 Tax=Patagioenas fasciata monilis TaxID=372326 RepID=A0A1V4KNQ3_PATFA|nr:hypothetical protein AV530_011238 [Patagioenas fasciata monilis]